MNKFKMCHLSAWQRSVTVLHQFRLCLHLFFCAIFNKFIHLFHTLHMMSTEQLKGFQIYLTNTPIDDLSAISPDYTEPGLSSDVYDITIAKRARYCKLSVPPEYRNSLGKESTGPIVLCEVEVWGIREFYLQMYIISSNIHYDQSLPVKMQHKPITQLKIQSVRDIICKDNDSIMLSLAYIIVYSSKSTTLALLKIILNDMLTYLCTKGIQIV